MNECVHEKLMLNGEIKNSIDFSEESVHSGLSIYEVLRIIRGKYLFLEDHILRLKSSLDLFNYKYISYIEDIGNNLLKYKLITDLKEGNVKIVLNYSNGVNSIPQIFIYQIKHYYPTSFEYQNGIHASLVYGVRNRPNAKFINLKINQLVAREFGHKNIFETLLVDEGGFVTEGSKSNVFFIKNRIVYTAPDETVLLGITRKHVIELCREMGISIQKTKIHTGYIAGYDAAFLSGTSVKILPIRQIDNYRFNIRENTMLRLMESFDIRIDDYLTF